MLEVTAAALAARLFDGKAPAAAQGRFFTPAELALVDELSEMIIPADSRSPGARAAGVAAYIDARLAESLDAEWQARWRSGLQAVDQLCRELNGARFSDATPEQRLLVLTRMAAGAADPKTPADRFFPEIKGWTVRGYYTSKIGIHVDQQYKGNVYQQGDYAGYDAE